MNSNIHRIRITKYDGEVPVFDMDGVNSIVSDKTRYRDFYRRMVRSFVLLFVFGIVFFSGYHTVKGEVISSVWLTGCLFCTFFLVKYMMFVLEVFLQRDYGKRYYPMIAYVSGVGDDGIDCIMCVNGMWYRFSFCDNFGTISVKHGDWMELYVLADGSIVPAVCPSGVHYDSVENVVAFDSMVCECFSHCNGDVTFDATVK